MKLRKHLAKIVTSAVLALAFLGVSAGSAGAQPINNCARLESNYQMYAYYASFYLNRYYQYGKQLDYEYYEQYESRRVMTAQFYMDNC